MKKNSLQKKFFESIALSMLALGIYNLVVQFFLYPFLNRSLGDEVFGDVLTLLSVMSVTAMSVGVGVNYSRLANKPRFESSNGDYNGFLLIMSVPVAVITAVSLLFFENISVLSYFILPLLSVVIMLRYYAEADFRLDVNYRKSLVFYMVLTVGYVVGPVFFKLTGAWETAMLTGELAAVIFVFIFGKILRGPYFKKSDKSREVKKSCAALSGSQLFSNLTLNADRLLISAFLSGTEVTVYYTASLLGKAMALLTGPISGVLIGFLAKTKLFGRKQFMVCSAAAIILGVVSFLVFIPLAPFVIGLLYPGTADSARDYYLLANGGQIVFFVSNLLLVIVLRFASEKLQLYINAFYSVAFFMVSIPSLIYGNLFVFCLAVFILNIIRMILILTFGFRHSLAEKKEDDK